MPYYNVVDNKKAVASASSTLTNFNPKFAIDGSSSLLVNNNRWVSLGGKAGEWLQVDLGAVARINQFRMVSGNSPDGTTITYAISDADFQIWQNDGWVTVGGFRGKLDYQGIQTVTLDKFYKTDKFRVYFPIDSKDTNYRIYEVEAYGRILGKKAKNTTSKNLLKPFTSSEWNFTVPVVERTPNRLVLTLDQSRTNEIILPAKPNTTYTLSGKTNGRVYFVQRTGSSYQNDKTGTGYSNYDTFSRTITTGSDVTGLRVSMTTDEAGDKFYENIMLNEGSYALPYQVYEQNMRYPLNRLSKKNLVPSFYEWVPSNPSNVTVKSVSDTTITFNASGAWGGMWAFFPVEPNKTYKFNNYYSEGATPSIDARYYVRFILMNGKEDNANYVNLLNTPTFTVPAGVTMIKLSAEATTTGAGKDLTFVKPQLEEGTVTTNYERRKTKGIPAKKLPKKNLLDYSLITKRAGTNNFTITGTRIDFDSNVQDYAGINLVIPDSWIVGKTVTWSVSERTLGCTPMLAYQKLGEQTLTYIGMSASENSKTVTIPFGASNMRFYVQNDAGKRGNFYVKDWQAEINSVATPYQKFKMSNNPAVLIQPKKNYLKPFTKWGAETSAGMTYEVLTDRKVVINYNSVSQYVGLQMSVDYSELFQLRGKNVTLSAKAIDRFGQSSTQVQARFWGSASGNVDFVLSNTQLSSTKFVPADFTGFFIKVQTNVIGTAKILVEDLQLEIGDKTPYEPYILGSKQAKY